MVAINSYNILALLVLLSAIAKVILDAFTFLKSQINDAFCFIYFKGNTFCQKIYRHDNRSALMQVDVYV